MRDGPGTRTAVMDNSTGGFVSPLAGLPSGMLRILREWCTMTNRIHLSPRDLGSSEIVLDVLCQFRQHYMEEVVRRVTQIGGEIKFKKPVVDQVYPELVPIFLLDLMQQEQHSIDGNLEVIKTVLCRDLGYSNQDLMGGFYLIGGDQMLVGQVRSIQMLRDSDVPGEDFRFVLPGLGPLHTLMNFVKMSLRLFLPAGGSDGSIPGSLYQMNKKLRRQNVDEECSNLWACLNFVKDATEACVLELMIKVSGCETLASFRSRLRGEIVLEDVLRIVEGMLEYSHVAVMRSEPEDKRDVVMENLLLFVCTGLEIRSFYKAMRSGDVGALEYIMQLWGVQFVGSRQHNYSDALMDIRVGMEAEWDERLKKVMRQNWVINPWGRRGKFLGLDEFMEEIVRNLKDLQNPGSGILETFAREMTARNVVYLARIKDEMRQAMGQRRRSGNHVKQDRTADVLALVDYLIGERVVEFIPGRGSGPGNVVKPLDDLLVEGIERMNEGEWWYDYLIRSPGCARLIRGQIPGGGGASGSNVEQYSGNMLD